MRARAIVSLREVLAIGQGCRRESFGENVGSGLHGGRDGEVLKGALCQSAGGDAGGSREQETFLKS